MQKLCCACTRQQFSASWIILSPAYHHISINSHPFLVGIVSDQQVSSFESQANQSSQSSIQRELLMPSPEVIDLTLSDDEIQPDLIRSNQGTSMPTRTTNCFRTSSSTPPHPVSTELGEFFQSFKVLLQPLNELKIIFHSNLSSATLILDKHSSTVSTTNTGLVYLTSTLWRPASTHTVKTVLSQKSL